jgi:hypothetical protein
MTDQLLRFETTPYRSEGGCPPGAFLLGLALICAAALGFGYLVGLLKPHFYISVIFPMVMGLAVGGAGVLAVRLARVRAPLRAAAAGLAGAAVALLAMHYATYRHYLDVEDEKQPGRRDQLVAQGFDFPEYMDQQAEKGVRVLSRRKNRGINLGYAGTYAYWLVELALAGLLAAALPAAQATEPFCPRCNTWKAKEEFGSLTHPTAAAVAALSDGAVTGLAVPPPGPREGRLSVTVAVCPNCGAESPIDVKLLEVTPNPKGEDKTKEVAHVTYPGESLPVFRALFADVDGRVGGEQNKGAADREPTAQ